MSMNPNKPKWTAVIRKIMHEDPVEVASFQPNEDFDVLISCEYKLAKIGKYYLLGRYDSSWENSYDWFDSAEKVKKEMELLVGDATGDTQCHAWQDPKLVDSIKDSAPLFGKEWSPDEIVREIEADENFRIRILCPDEEIPEEYEDY